MMCASIEDYYGYNHHSQGVRRGSQPVNNTTMSTSSAWLPYHMMGLSPKWETIGLQGTRIMILEF